MGVGCTLPLSRGRCAAPFLRGAGPALPGADAEADAAWDGTAATHGLTAVSPSGERVPPPGQRTSGGRRIADGDPNAAESPRVFPRLSLTASSPSSSSPTA